MTIDGCICIIAGVCISTHRTVGTTTIYVMENATAIDGNFCITLDETNSDVITTSETTTIDVAISGSALSFCSYGTVVNNDVCTTIHSGQRATTINRLHNSDYMTFHIVTNRDMRISCNGCCLTETTAKDILCNRTIVDVYCGIIDVAFRRCIGCLVTTAIYVVVNSTAVDIDGYRILRSTEIVVTTKHVVNDCVGTATFFHSHSHRTIDISSDCRNSVLSPLSFTTTIEVAGNGTAIEINLSFFSFCCRFFTIYQMRVYLTFGTTAIYVTSNIGIAYWITSCNGADIHRHVTCYMSGLTIAAAKDVTSDIDTHILISGTDIQGGIALYIGREATSVDASFF